MEALWATWVCVMLLCSLSRLRPAEVDVEDVVEEDVVLEDDDDADDLVVDAERRDACLSCALLLGLLLLDDCVLFAP